MKKYLIKNLFLCLILVVSFSCSSGISILVKNAIDAYNEGKYLTTLFFAEQALLENPNDKEALLIIIKAHLKLEEYQKANEYLDSLSVLSDNPEIFFLKGNAYVGLEEYEKAIFYLEKYLSDKIKSKNDFAYFNIAYCYFRLSEFDKALDYYLKYSSFNPKNSEVYLNIANLYGYLGKPDFALSYYNKVLLIDSTNYNALYNRSIEYQIQNRYNLSARDLELLNKYYPNDLNIIMDLAKVRIKEKKYFNAINELTKAIQLDSTNAEAYYLRGKSFVEMSRNFSACIDFKKAGNLGYFEAYEMIKKYCKVKGKK